MLRFIFKMSRLAGLAALTVNSFFCSEMIRQRCTTDNRRLNLALSPHSTRFELIQIIPSLFEILTSDSLLRRQAELFQPHTAAHLNLGPQRTFQHLDRHRGDGIGFGDSVRRGFHHFPESARAECLPCRNTKTSRKLLFHPPHPVFPSLALPSLPFHWPPASITGTTPVEPPGCVLKHQDVQDPVGGGWRKKQHPGYVNIMTLALREGRFFCFFFVVMIEPWVCLCRTPLPLSINFSGRGGDVIPR